MRFYAITIERKLLGFVVGFKGVDFGDIVGVGVWVKVPVPAKVVALGEPKA